MKNKVKKSMSIVSDGRSLVVRIPQKATKLLGIKKGDMLEFDVDRRRKTQKFRIIKDE